MAEAGNGTLELIEELEELAKVPEGIDQKTYDALVLRTLAILLKRSNRHASRVEQLEDKQKEIEKMLENKAENDRSIGVWIHKNPTPAKIMGSVAVIVVIVWDFVKVPIAAALGLEWVP